MRLRTWHFYVSGAIGGLVGFVAMEIVRPLLPSSFGEIVRLAFLFAAFGTAVGAALGMTEGLVKKKLWRAVYGLVLGALLGTFGGFLGGGAGQAIFGLLPLPDPPDAPGVDVAIVLDASPSMAGGRFLFWSQPGNDPQGLRLQAAQRLVDRLGARDRVAIVDFGGFAEVRQPLTRLDSKSSRRAVEGAIRRVGADKSGTNLSAGLEAGLGQLVSFKDTSKRKQHLIFLTDGQGTFAPAVLQPALAHGITVHTIGLGSEVDRRLLEGAIAQPTNGRYFPVAEADKLEITFDTILEEAIRVDMTTHDADAAGNPVLRRVLRIVSWGVMGLMIGLGQGVRENTREDLWVCSLGGAIGGLMGGAIFEPVSGALQLGSGLGGRAVADVVVGACIGGSMRFAQNHLVEQRERPTTTLLDILPQRSTALENPSPAASRSLTPTEASGLRGLVLKMKETVEGAEGLTPISPERPVSDPRTKKSAPRSPEAPGSAPRPEPVGRLKPLTFYEKRYARNRSQAMAVAFDSGHHAVEDIARHFGVPLARVERAIRDHEPRS